MKVLILFNVAGCLTPVIRHLQNMNHEVKVLNRKGYDPFSKSKTLNCVEFLDSARKFYLRTMSTIRKFSPDIIHLNGTTVVLKYIRMVTIRTPVILMYHGSDIRGRERPSRWEHLANVVLVSTPDLVEYGHHIGRPVDAIFSYKGGRIHHTAIMFYKKHFPKDQRQLAQKWANSHKVKLTIQENSIPHSDMPSLLSTFEYLLDFKGIDGALSLIALEAIQCGCKIVHDGNAPYETPASPESYLSLYTEIITKRKRNKQPSHT